MDLAIFSVETILTQLSRLFPEFNTKVPLFAYFSF